MSLDAERAELAPLLTLLLPDLHLRTHTPDALALTVPPSRSIFLCFRISDFCKLPGKLKACYDREPLSAYFLLGDVLYQEQH